jgi:hypothetical protein
MRHDCVSEYLRAANRRGNEAWILFQSEQRGGAIYLWGYVAECVLKSAWFRLIGHTDDQRVTRQDFDFAKQQAHVLGMQWAGNLHDLEAWSELIVRHRAVVGPRYNSLRFPALVIDHASRVYARWRETLRYRSNTPYRHEVEAVMESTLWLLVNATSI